MRHGIGSASATALMLALALAVGGCGSASHAPATTTAERPGAHTPASASSNPVDPAAALAERETDELRRLIAIGRPIYCAGRHGRDVALTFDDGPGPYTRLVLAKLRKHHVGATFFVVGRNIAPQAQLTREERALGAVGDHTFTHPLLTSLRAGEVESEIARTKSLLSRSSGGPVRLFRPPYGAHDATVDEIVREQGLLQILWTVDSRDSLGADYAQIEATVIAGMRPGAIILMHENHGQTVRALINIFAALKRKHLRAVSVPRLLAEDAPSNAQLRAGGRGCGAHGASTTGG